jgi:uncharacterized protein (TIGR03435 family)
MMSMTTLPGKLATVLAMSAIPGVVRAETAKQFDLVVIKPNNGGPGTMIQNQMGGKFVLTGVNLRLLISLAYDVRDFQITGGPGWAATDRFDVEAKVDGATERLSMEAARPMLQKLMEDRFQLKVRRDSKEMPIYGLGIAKGGSKLKPNVDKPGPRIMMGRGVMSGDKVAMNMLVQQLSQLTGRVVVDKTELKGDYDFKLEFTPEAGQGGLIGPPPPPRPDAPAADPNSVSIFTALQEQLGLKLDSQKGPVDVLVIDHAEKPSEN